MSDETQVRFDEAMMDVYRRALKECGYNATRFLHMLYWSGRLEMCQWRRETLDKESIWDEVRSTSLSRW